MTTTSRHFHCPMCGTSLTQGAVLKTSMGDIPVNVFRMTSLSLLSPRQREILEGIRMGKDNKAIADELGIQVGTVKIQITAIMRALGVRNRTQARIIADDLLKVTGEPP